MHLTRRSLLRGVTAGIALPWLEALCPQPLAADESANTTTPERILFLYAPNGFWQPSLLPPDLKPGWQPLRLTPTLEPLRACRDAITVVSGLDRVFAAGTGVHAQCGSCWLTSSAPHQPLDGGFPTNTTLDQLIAQQIGTRTLLPSLELSCNDHPGNKETHYFENISWYAPGYAASTEKDPAAVFQRLFGDNAGPGTSVLDGLARDATALRQTLSAADRQRLDEYLESVRATERRVRLAAELNARLPRPPLAAPTGIPADRGDYLRLMADLAVYAFMQDRTRVASLLIDPERWDLPRLYHGVFDKPQNHHVLTHTKGDEAKASLALIDRFHVALLAHVVNRLQAQRVGDGTLLDHTTVVMGSGLSDGDVHRYSDLTLLIAGGRWRRGHLHLAGDRPLADAWLSIGNAFGLGLSRFADSTGELRELR